MSNTKEHSHHGEHCEHGHYHVDENGNKVYHRHVHSDEEKKAVINRLSRISGHVEAVKKMVASDRDCSEVLVQLAAIKSAVNNTGKLVLKNHIEHCVVEAIENDDQESLEMLSKAIDSFIK